MLSLLVEPVLLFNSLGNEVFFLFFISPHFIASSDEMVPLCKPGETPWLASVTTMFF